MRNTLGLYEYEKGSDDHEKKAEEGEREAGGEKRLARNRLVILEEKYYEEYIRIR